MSLAFYYKDQVVYNNNLKESLHGRAFFDRMMTWLEFGFDVCSPFGGMTIEICNVLV
jgi:hypothetical protein